MKRFYQIDGAAYKVIEPAPAETPVIHAGEEAGVPFLGRGTAPSGRRSVPGGLPLPFCGWRTL